MEDAEVAGRSHQIEHDLCKDFRLRQDFCIQVTGLTRGRPGRNVAVKARDSPPLDARRCFIT